jgi:hypothetical protein
MEDYKLRDLCASHTLGWSWNWKTQQGFFFLLTNQSLRRRQAVWFGERKSAGEERSKCKMRGDETRSIAPL